MSREIDKLVAGIMGHEPNILWIATADGGKSYFFQSERKCEVEGFLKRTKEEYPNGWQAKGELGYWKIYKPYSSDIAAAWEVVEKMGITVTPGHNGWKAAKCNAGGSGETTWVGLTNHQEFTEADTAPLVISLCALKAKGIDVGVVE